MSLTSDKLYNLLPEVYRIRDEKVGYPLKALIDVFEREARLVEDDISGLYDNWFIETCQQWVIPYIADLLGVQNIHYIDVPNTLSQRAYIANTLKYRRRKGTVTVLEQLTSDISGWYSRAVEFFQLLTTTQNLNHIRLKNASTPDLRDFRKLQLVNTAFDSLAHTADFRSISQKNGWHNIPNIGFFIWRLQSYPLSMVTTGKIREGCYTFSPLKRDLHLFNQPKAETEITHIAEEINLPVSFNRQVLQDELDKIREALANGATPEYHFFGENDTSQKKYPSVLKLYLNSYDIPVDAAAIVIANLCDWHKPDINQTYNVLDLEKNSIAKNSIVALVDPVLGRITISDVIGDVKSLSVDYSYGFSGDIGGGPYNRLKALSIIRSSDIKWHAWVSKKIQSIDNKIFSTINEALQAWNNLTVRSTGLITVMDSKTFSEEINIIVKEGESLFILSSDWSEEIEPEQEVMGHFNPNSVRPHIQGDLNIIGDSPDNSENGGRLLVDGFLIEGNVKISGNLRLVQISNSTIVPKEYGITISENKKLQLQLIRDIIGYVNVGSSISSLSIEESIIDNGEGDAIVANYTSASIEKSTILGKTALRDVVAGNVIFTGTLKVFRNQQGCVRFCYFPPGSTTPRKFQCLSDGIKMPSFTSKKYGDPGYIQLSVICPEEIKSGGEDGLEIGAFYFLKQPQRLKNLKVAWNEYLPVGVNAGVIYIT
jgi:hypothetical protein